MLLSQLSPEFQKVARVRVDGAVDELLAKEPSQFGKRLLSAREVRKLQRDLVNHVYIDLIEEVVRQHEQKFPKYWTRTSQLNELVLDCLKHNPKVELSP